MKEISALDDFEPEPRPQSPDEVWSPPVVAEYLQWLDPETSRSAKAAAQAPASVPAPTAASGLWRPDVSLPSQKGASGLLRPDAPMPSKTGASGLLRSDASMPQRTSRHGLPPCSVSRESACGANPNSENGK